jgi:very-short-patch-repair endonuclease
MLDKKIIPYRPELTQLAKEFRNNLTRTEKILWERLKRRKLLGYDFHRQKPIGHYIVDFYCPKLMLAIEIDGNVHDEEQAIIKDEIRQDAIEQFGVRFLRFKNFEIEKDIDGVVKEIELWIEQHTL